MGRKKKRRVIKRVRPRLPSLFLCPACGVQSVMVVLKRKEREALIKCGSCGLDEFVKISEEAEPVDAYAKFIDKYSGSKSASPEKSLS